MPRLNQIIAIANGKKSQVESVVTRLYHQLQASAAFVGLEKTYDPKDEDGEVYPPDSKRLQLRCEDLMVDAAKAWSDFGYVSDPPADAKARAARGFRPYALTGWRDLGSTPEFESGASWAPGGGYEPLLKTAAFYLGYLQTNDRRMFNQLERTSWHWRDRRYIYLDGEWSDKPWWGHGGVYWVYYNQGRKAFPVPFLSSAVIMSRANPNMFVNGPIS